MRSCNPPIFSAAEIIHLVTHSGFSVVQQFSDKWFCSTIPGELCIDDPRVKKRYNEFASLIVEETGLEGFLFSCRDTNTYELELYSKEK